MANEILDTRDLIAEMGELESNEERDETDDARLAAIRELADAGIEDWYDGAQLIREDYFEDYARELAEDCGMIPNDLSWPFTCIDWEAAANDLSHDYSLIEFDGESYYVR